MIKNDEMLSAYIDGELSGQALSEIETLLKTDKALKERFDALKTANDLALGQMENLLEKPVSRDLAMQIKQADLTNYEPLAPPDAANDDRPPILNRRAMVASLAMLATGGVIGYGLGQQEQENESVSGNSWLSYVAGYHEIYASQTRHLVEVGAEESAHIINWLGNETEIDFNIPDLSVHGFEFKGARLLGVWGQPIAQLMYQDDKGKVLAICFKRSSSYEKVVLSEPSMKRFNRYDIVTWDDRAANFLVIANARDKRLKAASETVKLSI